MSASTMSKNCSEVKNCLFGFRVANDGHIVQGIVAFAAHTVKQDERCRWAPSQVSLRKFDDRDVVAQLFARPLSVAKH